MTIIGIYIWLKTWYVNPLKVNEINQPIKEDPMFYNYRGKGRAHG
jgi:hypothetical protein